KRLLEIAARLAKALGPSCRKAASQTAPAVALCIVLEDVVQRLATIRMFHECGKILVIIGALPAKAMACQPDDISQRCHCRSSATVSKDLNLASMSRGSTSPCNAL